MARAQSQSDDVRLREALKSTQAQLQDAQSQVASLQAAQAGQADDRKALADQLALVKKHAEEDRAADQKTIESLKAEVASDAKKIEMLKAYYVGWKAAEERAEAAAHESAAGRDQASYRAVLLQRQVDTLKTRNLELFDLGNEILTRYRKYSLGDQFLAKEPFIGRTRTRLENLIQDYSDKLLAQRADQ